MHYCINFGRKKVINYCIIALIFFQKFGIILEWKSKYLKAKQNTMNTTMALYFRFRQILINQYFLQIFCQLSTSIVFQNLSQVIGDVYLVDWPQFLIEITEPYRGIQIGKNIIMQILMHHNSNAIMHWITGFQKIINWITFQKKSI